MLTIVIITGSAGLIGAEASDFYANLGFTVIGIDNNLRATFFGHEGSIVGNIERLTRKWGDRYQHIAEDIRNSEAMLRLFKKYSKEISLVIHTAAQPSHDWAAQSPNMDFTVNANGTLNLLEALRQYAPEAVFIYTSTNKVYGDRPNLLPLIELEDRWEIDPSHPYVDGIPETMSIDRCLHSLFGVSKLAADLLVQEYGRYFGLKTVCFRGGVLTGAHQAGVPLHGFLNYLMRCVMTQKEYQIIGYKGKQVRDIIHAKDVVAAFHAFYKNPRTGGQVYNLGGGRESNISILEGIALAKKITNQTLSYTYRPDHRLGDHKWYISDLRKFKNDYPEWTIKYNVPLIMEEIYEVNKNRWI